MIIKQIKRLFNKVLRINNKLVESWSHILCPMVLLSVRLYMAYIFLISAKNKMVNMDQTVFLFEYEYAIPFINHVFAAYSATFFEAFSAIAIAIGFWTRVNSIPLIAITLVIQFLVYQNNDHFFWLLSLSTLLAFGAGALSVDRFVKIK